MDSDPPRLDPHRPFPPYSHVPGRFPHPLSDPAGHSYGVERETIAPFDPKDWRGCPAYLDGIELFNHGFYWEAHEAWEAVWHASGRAGVHATLLKGLIKLAAAGVKRRERRGAGLTSHPRRAREHFEEVRSRLPAGSTTCLGLSLDDLIRFAADAEELAGGALPEPARPVEVVFPFVLRPGDAP